jgi:hypothetical protein
MAVYTLFGQPANPASLISDTSAYTMGVQFVTSQPATLTAIWFFSASGAVSVPGTIALFTANGAGSGTLVTSQAASWSGAAGSGWVRAPFTTPPSLTANQKYKACILDNASSLFYSSTGHYWDTGAGQNGIASGPLSAPNAAGSFDGQDSFFTGGSLTYPTSQFSASNYWVDPEITVSAATPSGLLMASFP